MPVPSRSAACASRKRGGGPALPTPGGASRQLTSTAAARAHGPSDEGSDPADRLVSSWDDEAGLAAADAPAPAPAEAADQFHGMGFEVRTTDAVGSSAGSDLAGRAVGTLGLKSLGEMSYPGSSKPFEPLSVEAGVAEDVWAALADDSDAGVDSGEILATPYDSQAFLRSGSAKDRHHRYPEFTPEDVKRATEGKLRRVHDADRWIRMHESGISFEEQDDAVLAAGPAAPAADGEEPAVRQFARDDQALRRQLQEAVAAGDDETAELIAKRLVPLGKETSAEEARALLSSEAEGMTQYHKRVARFVEAVYGSRDVESDDELAQDGDYYDPGVARDADGVKPIKEEGLFTLDRILGENDPLRKRFLDREATGGWSRRDLSRGGLHLGYCIFCAHGDGDGAPDGKPLLREDNTLLLSKLVSPDGRILPRRFTGVCRTHQRQVSRTINRSRALGFMPFQKKLPPSIRFTSLEPDPSSEPGHSHVSVEEKPDAAPEATAELDAALDELQSMLDAPAAMPRA